MVPSPIVDAAAVLQDLLEVSGQIEGAILLERDGAALACTLDETARADALEAATRGLIEAAADAPGGRAQPLVQLQVVLGDGCAFVVQDEQRVAACVTGAKATPGLVFYDLKTALRRYAGDDDTPSPRPWTGGDDAEGGDTT